MGIKIDEIKKTEDLSSIIRYCKICGASNYVPKYSEKKHCKFCGNLLFYDKKAEFKYKLGRKLRNANKRRTVSKDDKK